MKVICKRFDNSNDEQIVKYKKRGKIYIQKYVKYRGCWIKMGAPQRA